jgi:hypothetical protein
MQASSSQSNGWQHAMRIMKGAVHLLERIPQRGLLTFGVEAEWILSKSF